MRPILLLWLLLLMFCLGFTTAMVVAGDTNWECWGKAVGECQ